MKENDIIISAIVPCYNASKRISDTIHGLVNQSSQKDKYEVIIVDNGSEDYGDLFGVINKIDLKKCNFKIIQEMHLGLSYAKNRGVKESKGEYVYFIDDDAVPSAQLIESYINAINETRSDVIGGNILPFFEVKPNSTLDSSVWGQWSIKYFGETDRWLTDNEYFLGTNIGAKKSILLTHKFDPALGRKGSLLTGGEEWFLGGKQFKRRFVANAFVFHKIPEKRMKMDYFVNRLKGFHLQTNQDYKLPSFFKNLLSIVIESIKKAFFSTKFRMLIEFKTYKNLKSKIF